MLIVKKPKSRNPIGKLSEEFIESLDEITYTEELSNSEKDKEKCQ